LPISSRHCHPLPAVPASLQLNKDIMRYPIISLFLRRLASSLTSSLTASLVAACLLHAGSALAEDSVAPAQLEFSLIKTSEVSTLAGLAYSGGSYFHSVKLNHMAVLVRHGQDSFLFDTGLGRQIDSQFKQDMPFWAKPFFSYGPVKPAREQLDAAGIKPPARIFLSHAHWDHASALEDFTDAEIWLSNAEKTYLATPHKVAVFPSQISSPALHWHGYAFEPKPYLGFAQSLDIFGDGSAVLVPLPGHTPGSVGLFLSVPSGKQYFFIGDTAWRSEAIAAHAPKMWLAGKLVDHDAEQTMEAVASVQKLQSEHPAIMILPAHDAEAQDKLGYFPQFIK
jgi:glyoxylase-like metal-dependent hydrolase (beta-lactamase superfamily II)